MNTATAEASRIVIMGIGNTLLQDDGAGVHVTEALRSRNGAAPGVAIIDGGTLGLALLPEIEEARSLIVVDAAEIGEPPGTIRVFRNQHMDRQLSGRKSTVHELALSDLLEAAALRDRQPRDRVLVAIQPACTEWGLEPTEPVRESIPLACDVVDQLTRELDA